jgi:hypothetical protein
MVAGEFRIFVLQGREGPFPTVPEYWVFVLTCELQESDKGRGFGPVEIFYPLGEEGVGYDSSVGGVLRRGVDVDGALALGHHRESLRSRRSGVQEETCETFLSLALFIMVPRVLTNA